ncbi:MAG: helix-turn-helix domain-containing protein [Alphaproteobacteria bacterium]|nr:helix-turn-helix domain-containing protein [Alphaproteobacteria bacterium]MBU1560715.1 helix-turn-helix domain-containing protein [Alphaproteobacteria bacterium]MBU2302924.1 helix-turn-helix domain-containing protein [Alphaproteobacteria bacterium]MBU2367651.1 helix-turn-helix domain-containing protein [Alphaproteobacteria bacterium]
MSEQQHQPSPAQIRAGRALLDWSQEQLAARSGIGRRTVAAYENGGERVTTSSIHGMKEALERGGIRFSGDDEPEGVHRAID